MLSLHDSYTQPTHYVLITLVLQQSCLCGMHKYTTTMEKYMLNAKGNLFRFDCDAICITTNGFVKANGECVMGKGCAKAIQQYVPNIPSILGAQINAKGNHVHLLVNNDVSVVSYPVKPITKVCSDPSMDVVKHMQSKFKVGSTIPGWACVADLDIIEQSAKELVALADEMGWKRVCIPRPGCGAGELSWDIVEPILSKVLDDRFTAITF